VKTAALSRRYTFDERVDCCDKLLPQEQQPWE